MAALRTLKPLYVALVGVALAASIAVAATCTNGASPTPSPASTPTLEAVVTATPTPRRLEDTPTPQQTYNPPISTVTATPIATAVPPTATSTPRPTVTPQQPTATSVPPTVPPVLPTVTSVPPSPTATPTQTLEQLAQSIVDKYRNDTTTTITDYGTIKPIVDAVLKDSGLKYNNLIPQIWTPERFNRFYCENDPKCVEALNKDPSQGSAFVSDRFVITREGQFYQVITSALREMLLGIAFNNYNAKSVDAAEIAGNLGSSFANHTLAEKFGYDLRNNVADTPENRERTRVRFVHEGKAGWVRSVWLINESRGYLDRSKPEVALTAAQALDAYKFFVNLPDPDKHATDLAQTHTLAEDNRWVTQVLQLRLKKDKTPSTMDATVLNEQLFYIP